MYIGSAVFKVLRLLTVASFSVHLFACLFFRVKVMSAVTEDHVVDFYASKGIGDDVSSIIITIKISRFLLIRD